MTINLTYIVALLVAALLGNTLLFRLCRVSTRSTDSGWRGRILTDLLVVAMALALGFAGWEIYWNRSEDVMLAVLLFLPVQSAFAAILFFRHHRRRGSPPGWGRLLLGNGLVLLCLLTLALAVGEVYFRFIFDTTDSIACTKVAKRWMKRYYHLNKSKVRDDVEYALTLLPGKRRISFVGDSFTVGHGIKNIEDRFANRVRRLHPDWEVQVLAGNGLDTGGELALLDGYTAHGYQIDEVVLVYCLNDVDNLLTDWIANLEKIAHQVRQRPLICEDSYLLDTLYFRLVTARLPWIRTYFSHVRAAYHGEKWEQQGQRLRALRDLVASRGGRLSVVTFPFLDAVGPDYPYQSVHDELNAFWREEEVPHLDLLPVFKAMRPTAVTVHRYDAHPNQLAHGLAAERMNAFLLDQMAANSPPAAIPR